MIQKTIEFLERQKKLLAVLIALLTILTLLFTLLPSDNLFESSVWKFDKLGHTLLFGTWTFLLGLYILIATKKSLPLFALFLIGAFFGISIEILQEVLPVNRAADPYDALADMIGCLVAVILLKFITRKSD
jgi:VanZ family protein